MEDGSWLHDWIDSEGITHSGQVQKALKDSKSRRALLDASSAALEQVPSQKPSSPQAVVASGGLDLSGFLTCGHPACRRQQIDDLFAVMWHYFDQVVVSGPLPLFEDPSDDEAWEITASRIESGVDSLLYIREIGAEDLLVFRRKTFYCEDHLPQHAADAGIPQVASDAEVLMRRFQDETSIRYDESPYGPAAFLSNPLVELSRVILLEKGELPAPREEILDDFAHDVIPPAAANLVSDALTARGLGLPLAAGSSLTHAMLRPTQADTPLTDSQVALRIPFPFLQNLPTKELIALMKDERAHYIRFRTSIRAAIRDHLEGVSNGSKPEDVANSVFEETIRPSLAELQVKMKAAKDAITRKAGTELVAGAATTTVGVIAGMPLLAASGVAAVGDAVRNALAYFDQKKNLEQDDLYFLWQAEEVARKASDKTGA